jgi:hypothetical protein
MAGGVNFVSAPPSQSSVRGVPLRFKLTRLSPGTEYSVVCAADGGGLSGRYDFTTAVDVCQQGDPCATGENVDNFCLKAGSEHVCTCDGDGWKVGPSSKSCVAACPSNDCSTEADPANTCTMRTDGSYFCTCGPGWTASTTACVLPMTPAAPISPATPISPCFPDPCSGDENSNNRCFVLGADRFQCACEGGWLVAADGKSCLRPITPTPASTACNQNQCQQSKNRANVCTTLSQSEFVCTCGGYGYTRSSDGLSCVEAEIVQTCKQADYCSAAFDARNVCLDRADGTYVCRCYAPGWSTAPGGGKCLAPSMTCVNDECRSVADPDNVCVDKSDGTYRCVCEGTGWRQPADALSCRPPSTVHTDTHTRTHTQIQLHTHIQTHTYV